MFIVHHQRSSQNSDEEPSPITRDRSTSTPNVSSAHITGDSVLAAEFLTLARNNHKDARITGMVQLEELYNLAFTSSTASSSPSKSSRSVSSSPTSSLKPRARASSADESASKKIKHHVPRESIENWEISPNDIWVYKKNIGMGSFGTVYQGQYYGNVAVKTLNVKNPSAEQIQAFRNEVAIYMATYSSLNGPYHGILKFLGRQGEGLDQVCQVTGKDDDATESVLFTGNLSNIVAKGDKTVELEGNMFSLLEATYGGKNGEDDEAWKKEATCHHCGKKGHIRPDCRILKKDIEKGVTTLEEAKKKTEFCGAHAEAEVDDNDDEETPEKSDLKTKVKFAKKGSCSLNVASDSDDDEEDAGFSFLMHGREQKSRESEKEHSTDACMMNEHNNQMRDWVLLDNQSTVDIFCNKKSVSEVQEADDEMVIETDGGMLVTNDKGPVKNCGWVWHHPKAIDNVLSLSDNKSLF